MVISTSGLARSDPEAALASTRAFLRSLVMLDRA